MQLKLQLAFAAVLLSTTSLTNVQAQENQTPNGSLGEVTVYATLSPQSTFDVPSMVTVLDADAPGNASAGTISDLLQFVPGVAVDNGPRRSSQIITIRGFDDEAIVTLIDGRRQNFESGHDGRFFIDPSLLKSVEVVRGASSSTYGGGAIGGVVAMETKDASDLLEPGKTIGATSTLGYRSATGEFHPSQSVYGRYGDLDLLANVSYRKAGDVQQGDGNELHARDRVYSGLFKAGYTFNDFHTVKLNLQRLKHDAEEPSNSAAALSTSNLMIDRAISDLQMGLVYEFENPDRGWLNPKLHLYRNNSEVEETNLTGTNQGRVRSREMTTNGLAVSNQSKYQADNNQVHTVSYGFEYYADEQVGYSSVGTYGGVPDADLSSYGLFVQDNIELATSAGLFSIIPALRFDSYSSDDDVGNSQNESAFSPKVSVSYKPTESFLLFGSWAKAFRAPNLTETYADGLHYFGNNFIQNPDLKPETVTTIELGAGLDFKQVLSAEDTFRLKGSVFQSKGKDFIDQEVATTTTQYVNVPNAKLQGWEAEAAYTIASITATVGASYVKATNDDTKAYLDSNEPRSLTTGLSYQSQTLDSEFGWRAKFARQNNKATSAASLTSGYSVHDLFYRYAPAEGAMKDFKVDLGIENIFDNAYTANFAALYEEGRSYTARVTYKW